MNFRFLFCILACLTTSLNLPLQAQDTLQFSLDAIIELAQQDAPDVQIAETQLSNSYWRYQSFLADYKPRIDLNANSDIRRAVEAIDLPDGDISFVERSFMTNRLGLSLRQDVALTGGTIFTSTSMERLDLFTNNDINYLISPISLRIEQPIFAFNPLKWNRRVQPLVYEESQQAFSEEMASIASEAARLYFNLLIAQLNQQATRFEKNNADTLLELSQGRYEVGRIAETELLQIELSAKRADASLASASVALQSANEALRNFLGINRSIYFVLETPEDLPALEIDPQQALTYARQLRSKSIEFERRVLESELQVARAQGEAGPNLNLTGSFGLQENTQELNTVFENLTDQQLLRLGLQLPIADWGKNKSRLEIARSQRDLTQMQVAQERVSFEQEVLLQVKQFELIRNQVDLAKTAYDISIRRNQITRERYLVGKIGITDLNLAISEQESARRQYLEALRSFWIAFYRIQELTLFDFQNNQPLIQEIQEPR